MRGWLVDWLIGKGALPIVKAIFIESASAKTPVGDRGGWIKNKNIMGSFFDWIARNHRRHYRHWPRRSYQLCGPDPWLLGSGAGHPERGRWVCGNGPDARNV